VTLDESGAFASTCAAVACRFMHPQQQLLMHPSCHVYVLCGAHACRCRQHINKEKLTMDDGLVMRVLADSPGGLELHIGVGWGCWGVRPSLA
jgi:hypothetical protein